MNEAFSESAEHHQRPELDRSKPAKLFEYAREKQRWAEQLSERQRIEAVDYLANELERYVTETFDSLPELTITTSDVHYTKAIHGQGSRHAIETGPLPLDGDAQLLGEHEMKGILFGFHRGDEHDLRAYVSMGDEPQYFMGGIYTPLLSVGVEKSSIHLTQYTVAEELEKLATYIDEQLVTSDEHLREPAHNFMDILRDTKKSPTKKLHEGSVFLTEITKDTLVMPRFVDALLEMAKLELQLDEPQDIQTQLHRVVISQSPISAYKPVPGQTSFSNIDTIQLGMIGETSNKSLGIFFINNEQAVQIPVQYITSIYRSVQ